MPDLHLPAPDTLPQTLDRILFGDLCPWNRSDLSEAYYQARFDELKPVKTDFPFRFDFNFPKPFNAKTKYYNRLIRNQVLLVV